MELLCEIVGPRWRLGTHPHTTRQCTLCGAVDPLRESTIEASIITDIIHYGSYYNYSVMDPQTLV